MRAPRRACGGAPPPRSAALALALAIVAWASSTAPARVAAADPGAPRPPLTPLAAETYLFYSQGPTLIVAAKEWAVLAPLTPAASTSDAKAALFIDGGANVTAYRFNPKKLPKAGRGLLGRGDWAFGGRAGAAGPFRGAARARMCARRDDFGAHAQPRPLARAPAC
jgi:hypothetical protein